MGLKARALLGNFPHRAETKNLIAAAIGQDRPIPTHEFMQAAQVANQFMPRPQVKMIGIAEQNLATQLLQISRQHRLDGPLGSHRHEGGSLHHAVSRDQATEARFGVWIFLDDGEMIAHQPIFDFSPRGRF